MSYTPPTLPAGFNRDPIDDGDSWITDKDGKIIGVSTRGGRDFLISVHGADETAVLAPANSWRDIIGSVSPKAVGLGAPVRAVLAGGVVADWSFVAGDVCDFGWHIPHDYVPGTDILWHVHFSHNGTTISGSAVFDLFYKVAKRDGTFSAEKQLTITCPTVDIATTPSGAHRVRETPMSSAVGSTILIPASAFEVDGFVVATLRMTTLPAMGGSGKLFIHTSDLHYQSNNVGTRLSGFPFY